jgi:predicted transcriptional regulator
MEKQKQVRRSKEERVAEIDAKIEYHKSNIATLEKKKKDILAPKKKREKKTSYASVFAKAKENMSADEIAKKLGIKVQEL